MQNIVVKVTNIMHNDMHICVVLVEGLMIGFSFYLGQGELMACTHLIVSF